MPKFSRYALCFSAFVLSSPALSAEWKTRVDDARLSEAELTLKLSGQTLTYFDGGTSAFETDGRYAYTYGGGSTWLGHYVIGADSTACVTFVTGVSRCDLYVLNKDRLTVITEDGMRFPIKSVDAN